MRHATADPLYGWAEFDEPPRFGFYVSGFWIEPLYHSAARFYQKCASGARGSGPHRRLQHGANLFPDRFSALETILITVAILNAMWLWNDFLLPQLVINKPGWQTLPLKTFLFFGQFSKRWDLATAGLLMCMAPIVLFYLFCQKYIIKGVTEGAVKG